MATNRAEILEENWFEFLGFVKGLRKQVTDATKGKDDDLISLMALMDDIELVKLNALWEEFQIADEPTFWKWYAVFKLEEKKK